MKLKRCLSIWILNSLTIVAIHAQSTEPIEISRGEKAYEYQAFPDACRLQNEDIVAVFYAGYGHVSLPNEEFPLGGRLCIVRSSDEGQTWTEPAILYDDKDDNRDPHISQLGDGTLICTFFSLNHDDDKETNSTLGRVNRGVQIITSSDNGVTWDQEARSLFKDWYCSAPVRQLADGTCVLGLYQQDAQSERSIGGSTRSTDGGETWEEPIPIRAPGVSLNAETDIIELKEHRLYAALRSTKDDMYYALSDDGAKSWSEAKPAGFPAHSPHLNRLSTGEIILSHRLPNTSIHLSYDDTQTWKGPYQIDSCIGAYPATVELQDGTILIIYYTEGENSVVRARRFEMETDGIKFLSLRP